MSIPVTGLEIEKINKCVGDPEANEENEILKAEQDAQVRLCSYIVLLPYFLKGVFVLTRL